MLPFLKPKKVTSVLAKTLPDGEMSDESAPDPGLSSACDDLISAIHAKDSNAVATALKAAFAVIDSSAPPMDEASDLFNAEG